LRHIALRCRVLPHLPVHGRGDHQGAIACQAQGGEQIVALTLRQPGDHVGRCRRDHDEVRIARQVDVRHVVAHARIPQVGPHRVPTQRLEGHRRHEVRTAFGQHHMNTRPFLDQQTGQFRCLVGSHAARHPEDDLFSL
jgi:hypothetical protein